MPARSSSPAGDYDALLVVSFGGPEGPDEVLPFLDRVLAGRPLPPPVKQRIAGRYQRFGGVSPINSENRRFIAALEDELHRHDMHLPVYWGNRNWHPLLGDTVRRMAGDGVQRALVYITSLFACYSGCRQYRENLYEAAHGIPGAPQLDKLRLGYNHPRFIAAMAERVAAAHRHAGADAAVVFTAHSVPQAMAAASDYEAQLAEACSLVAAALDAPHWQLAFQSNNARTGEPWLRPTVEDALESVRDAGRKAVVVAPIGFVCAHMEVVMDLDIEAREQAEARGLDMVRAATVGTHPDYVAMVRELVAERMAAGSVRPCLGSRGAAPDRCAANCCLPGKPTPLRPALCGSDQR